LNIELIDPKTLDIYCTRDRVSIRVTEPGLLNARMWVILKFDDGHAAMKFLDDAKEKLVAKMEENRRAAVLSGAPLPLTIDIPKATPSPHNEGKD
jgi:hypothetical protein